jgi:hypothetical protein
MFLIVRINILILSFQSCNEKFKFLAHFCAFIFTIIFGTFWLFLSIYWLVSFNSVQSKMLTFLGHYPPAHEPIIDGSYIKIERVDDGQRTRNSNSTRLVQKDVQFVLQMEKVRIFISIMYKNGIK